MNLELALLIIRLVLGLTMMGHGAQKLFGWFGGHGPRGTGGWFESIGMKPGVLMAVLAGLAEFGGGLLVATGLFTHVGVALLILTMIVAIVSVHGKNGYWSTSGGFEYNLLLIAVLVGLMLSGAGDYSLDALL
ncbi:DoxX family protein [Paenibacillus sp. 3LSP]|uniref:DoxX family protein n=1 Tax=Paenibacillus sp. 3LSP TaxID=2800795 RepID=UPI0028FD0D86|nr:DoxX family protein [Paenibacillus sp. 3LSP]MDU0332458.1 DoxX family protein [Paenibacillus sp. 3LSP]